MKNKIRIAYSIIGFASILIVTSCETAYKNEETSFQSQTEKTLQSIKDGQVEIVKIDGCEYLIYKEHIAANQGFGYMSHKGNCSNPIHCFNQNKFSSDSLSSNIK